MAGTSGDSVWPAGDGCEGAALGGALGVCRAPASEPTARRKSGIAMEWEKQDVRRLGDMENEPSIHFNKIDAMCTVRWRAQRFKKAQNDCIPKPLHSSRRDQERA